MRVQTQVRAGMYASITLSGGGGSGPAVQQPIEPGPAPINTLPVEAMRRQTMPSKP